MSWSDFTLAWHHVWAAVLRSDRAAFDLFVRTWR